MLVLHSEARPSAQCPLPAARVASAARWQDPSSGSFRTLARTASCPGDGGSCSRLEARSQPPALTFPSPGTHCKGPAWGEGPSRNLPTALEPGNLLAVAQRRETLRTRSLSKRSTENKSRKRRRLQFVLWRFYQLHMSFPPQIIKQQAPGFFTQIGVCPPNK